MPTWSPATWGEFSLSGLIIFIAAVFFLALAREWIVPGPAHRGRIADKDAELERKEREINYYRESSTEKDKTIQVQATSLAEKNAVEILNTRLLQSVRESVERGS